MSHPSVPTHCVVHGDPRRSPLSTVDAVVIVVIAVLACGLSATGLSPSSVLSVLSGAGVVAAGTLMAVRGGSRTPGRRFARVLHAVTTT
ncbi:hypothetical protein [Streptomyces sp. OR43]|uniref:hypothetical protein n=1 Tax=Streptomyces sp. or43 TaxID=2478957 RepID=UPI0011CE05E3|nr:hypothetical protein [Streptomyces sp. or43]TXS42217.1 hypothetical protein EAO72_15325 [Streptomyces sp. or43]